MEWSGMEWSASERVRSEGEQRPDIVVVLLRACSSSDSEPCCPAAEHRRCGSHPRLNGVRAYESLGKNMRY